MVITQVEAATRVGRAPAASVPENEEYADLPELKVQGLSVAYGDLWVLNGVDFEVPTGGLVALVGENGAGKSTLVRCIAGDIVPDAGEVALNGARVRSNAAAASAGLAVVWQDAALCDNLDVASNLFLGREQGRWFTSDDKNNLAAKAVFAFVRDQAGQPPPGAFAVRRPAPAARRGPGHADSTALIGPGRADGVARCTGDAPGRRAHNEIERRWDHHIVGVTRR